MRRLLNRIFRLEEINGDRCPTYLYRWTLARAFGCALYLHKFVGNDWTLDLHDRPKRFISIGLRGGYQEETVLDLLPIRCVEDFRAPWIRSFPARHTHRLSLLGDRPCWTLVITLRTVRKWGFWLRSGHWVGWREYLKLPDADERKDCS